MDGNNYCCVEPKGKGSGRGEDWLKGIQIAPRSAWLQRLPAAPSSPYSVFLCQTCYLIFVLLPFPTAANVTEDS